MQLCRNDNVTVTLHRKLPQNIVFTCIRKQTFNIELLKPSLRFVQYRQLVTAVFKLNV